MPRRVPDVSKANKQVGFQPTVDLEGILKSVIAFHTGQQSQEQRSSAAEG
jgi:nucleoside-diphosphate-sugar epimerase